MSDASPVLGIDLGTTNSVVAIADGTAARVITDPEGNRLIPSCVSFTPDGTIVVGHAARERRLVDAENTVYSIKRLIGRPYAGAEVQRAKKLFPFVLQPSPTGAVQVRTRKGDYSLPEVSAMVLRHLRKVAELSLGEACTRAVITVPANFNELQRSATQAAGKVAGLQVMRILNEPTAATLAYGYGKDRPETVAVYDLGGGTFDITILHLDGDVFEVISTAGDTFLGGDDVDLVIAERMVEESARTHGFDARREPQAFERMRAAAEWAKCQLSSVAEVDLTLEQLFEDRAGRAVDFSFRFTQAELESRARPLIARSFDVVAEALREAGKRPREIDSVVMVGGSTRIPLVRAMVAEHFGRPPRVDIDPDLVVAQGAAIHAWTLAGRPEARGPRPMTSALGRSPLRSVTVADPGLPKRGTIVGGRPRGPAFAPEESPLGGVMPLGPRRLAQALAGERPIVSGDPMARTSLESVAVLQPPASVGAIGGAGLLLDLDDPLVRDAAKKTTRDPSARAGASPRAVPPAAIDAPFAAPNAKGLVGASVDAPFDSPARSTSKARRDPTMPFGLPARPEAAPLDDPFVDEAFGAEEVFSPEEPSDHGADAGADPFADIPLPLPEPEPLSEPSGLFEIETESVPPPRAPLAPPPPPPPPPRQPAPPPEPQPELDFEPPLPPLAPRIAELPMPSAPAPLLMDVTPLTLSLETAGGYCAAIVPRNAPLPAEKSRVFSTARDGQEAVEVRICQGESIQFGDNQLLGTLVLDGIRRAARGTVRIEITFLLDASGILDVRAVDLDTHNEQHTRIALQGGIDAAEIEAMRRRQDRELS